MKRIVLYLNKGQAAFIVECLQAMFEQGKDGADDIQLGALEYAIHQLTVPPPTRWQRLMDWWKWYRHHGYRAKRFLWFPVPNPQAPQPVQTWQRREAGVVPIVCRVCRNPRQVFGCFTDCSHPDRALENPNGD